MGRNKRSQQRYHVLNDLLVLTENLTGLRYTALMAARHVTDALPPTRLSADFGWN